VNLAPSGHRAAAALEPSRLLASTAATVSLTILVGGFCGVILVAKPELLVACVALVLALTGCAVAMVRPGLAFGGLTLMVALVPSYASPSFGPILFIPGAAAAWCVAGTLLWRNAITTGVLFKPNYVDLAAGAFALLMAVSVEFSPRAEMSEWVQRMFLWAGPYLAARLLLADVEKPLRTMAISFAIPTVLLAPIALAESLGGSNPFYNLNLNSTEFSIWASQIDRFGEIRAVTSFGHPIAFSIFLAVSCLLSLAMGIDSNEAKRRRLWYALAAVSLGTMALALSRTGWLMLAVGVSLLAVVSVRGPVRRRLFTIFVIIAAVIAITAVVMPQELNVLPGFGDAQERNYASSGLYREALLERALQPGVLGLWGNAANQVTPTVQYGTATDNAYIILADTWGLIPTFALLAVVVTMLIALARCYGQTEETIAVLPIAGLACLVAIFFVAFITQQQTVIWLVIGAAGVAAERASASRRRARRPQRASGLVRR
jgi:hypothetical protein